MPAARQSIHHANPCIHINARRNERRKKMLAKFRNVRVGSLVGAIVLVAAMVGAMLFPSQAFAATVTKTYTITSGNTPVYSTSALQTRIGAIYGSDEVVIRGINRSSTQVTYPIAGGTKTGWIRTSDMLVATSGYAHNSRSRFTTYRRPGGSTYGSVYVGDQVLSL